MATSNSVMDTRPHPARVARPRRTFSIPNAAGLAKELIWRISPEGWMVLDPDLRIEDINPAAREILYRWHGRNAQAIDRPPEEITTACRKLGGFDGDAVPEFGQRVLVKHSSDPDLSAIVTLERSMIDRRLARFCAIFFDQSMTSAPKTRRDLLGLLTHREREVARHVCRGLRNSEIACETGKSILTVKKQVTSIFRKVGVRTRTELVRLMLSPE